MSPRRREWVQASNFVSLPFPPLHPCQSCYPPAKRVCESMASWVVGGICMTILPMIRYKLYLVCFLPEKDKEDSNIGKECFKNEAYHCQAPELQSSHAYWKRVFHSKFLKCLPIKHPKGYKFRFLHSPVLEKPCLGAQCRPLKRISVRIWALVE